MAKKKTLAENAADVLAASIAKAGSDSFGLGKKLHPAGVPMNQVDLGAATQRSTDAAPDYTRGVPTATPPGATPPVGKEEMHKLKTQPQQTSGRSDLAKDPTGSTSYNFATYMNRGKNTTDKIHIGQGNVMPPWANESVEEIAEKILSELKEPTLAEEKKSKKGDKFDFFKKDDKFGKAMKKVKDCSEEVNEDEVLSILLALYEGQETIITPEQKLAEIVAEALAEQKQDLANDVSAMFEGETLSDDFRSKATTIFEAAVASQVKVISEKVSEKAIDLISEAATQIEEAMSDKVDGYLSYMVEQWVSENEIAIEKGLRAEIVEDFIAGLRTLFIENYIDIPEEKVDMVEEQAARIAALEEKLSEQIEKNMEFKGELDSIRKEKLVDSVCEGLTQTQKAKISSLTEGVAFGNEKEFTDKVKTLRENYFPNAKVVVPDQDSLNTDQLIIEDTNGKTKIADPFIEMISNSISRTVKR